MFFKQIKLDNKQIFFVIENCIIFYFLDNVMFTKHHSLSFDKYEFANKMAPRCNFLLTLC